VRSAQVMSLNLPVEARYLTNRCELRELAPGEAGPRRGLYAEPKTSTWAKSPLSGEPAVLGVWVGGGVREREGLNPQPLTLIHP
jgi:hypothetical protein